MSGQVLTHLRRWVSVSEFRYQSQYGYRARNRRKKKAVSPGKGLRLWRTAAEIRVNDETVACRVLLNDIFPRAIFLFSPKAIAPDEEIAVSIDAPTQFYAVGRVVSCHAYRMNSRVIEADEFSYRVSIAFYFDNESEADDVRSYVSDLRSRFVFK